MMSGFLYFRPGQTKSVSLQDVRAWGLAYAFDNRIQTGVCHANTPSGGAGVIFADPSRHGDGRVRMDMGTQEWHKMPRPGQQDVYIGWWKEAKPAVTDLARREQLSGYTLALRDKSQWLVPLVRFFDKTSEQLVSGLPTDMALDESGNFVAGDVVGEHAYLWDLVSRYANAMQSGQLVDLFAGLSMQELCADAKRLLQANYVVDTAEIVHLGLWQVSRDECQEANAIILAAIDYSTYSEWDQIAKKKPPSPAAAAG